MLSNLRAISSCMHSLRGQKRLDAAVKAALSATESVWTRSAKMELVLPQAYGMRSDAVLKVARAA